MGGPVTTTALPPAGAVDGGRNWREFLDAHGELAFSDDPYDSRTTSANFHLDSYLAKFDPALLATPEGRKVLCKYDPMLFALVYLRKHLRNNEGELSFADAHFLWVRAARRWIGPSRGQRQDRRAFVAPRSCGKPLAVDGMVLMGDGSRKRLGDIEIGDWVITDKGRARRVTAVHEQGELPAVRIHTRRGRIADAALDHPFLTERGWVEAGRLIEGDRIVTVPDPQVITGAAPSAEEFALAGYFIGDGAATTSVAYRGQEVARANGINSTLTCADPIELEHIREIADRLGFTISGPHGAYSYHLGGGVKQWLRAVGIAASSSYTKRVPQWVFRAPNQRIAEFLAAYFACDGTTSPDGNNSEFYSVSRNLLLDTQHLLLRLGIQSTLKAKRGRINGEVHHSWRLRIENAALFAKLMLPHLRSVKADRLRLATGVGRFGTGDHVTLIEPIEPTACRCLTVDEDHTFTYQDLVVHNSTWWFLILPMWAGAYGHVRFAAAFADSGAQAELHLATFKAEQADNILLRTDFEDFCQPARRHTGRTVADNQNMLHTRDGFTFVAKGIDSTSLGMKMGEVRPDLLIFDDIEPPEATYSPFQREKRLSTVENAILPLNEMARVAIVGTVTMPGSIIHELVRHAKGEDVEPWVDEQQIRTYHTRPIIMRPDGSERSVWPKKWTMEYLASIRHTRSFKLNYDNDPKGRAGDYWQPEDIKYAPDVEHGRPPNITKWFLFVDPPVTMKTRSDDCGLALVGYAPGVTTAANRLDRAAILANGGPERLREALMAHEVTGGKVARLARVHIEEAWGVHLTGKPLRAHILSVLLKNPQVKAVILESNQGGSLWNDVFDNLPVKFVTFGSTESKEVRFARALDYFQTNRVTVSRVMPQFEDQALAWPRVPHDDVVDAVCSAILRLLTPKHAQKDGTVVPR